MSALTEARLLELAIQAGERALAPVSGKVQYSPDGADGKGQATVAVSRPVLRRLVNAAREVVGHPLEAPP